MIRILHFGKYYFPDAGGIENVTLYLARGAVAGGHEATVVCFGSNARMSEEYLDGVRVIRAPMAALVNSQPLGLGYVAKCLQLARKADVVHLHAPNMLASICALFIGHKTRLLVHWHSDVLKKGFIARLLLPLERALLKRADGIVATSPTYAEASQPLAPFRHKVAVVPLGVPDTKPQGSDTETLPSAIAARVEGKRIILAVGRLVPYKGFDVLIKAAQHIAQDAIVVIVGGGPLQQDLGQAVTSAGVADRVVLTGRLDEASLHSLFNQASLYCLPSNNKAEAFGVVLLEAMTYGLPIVATNIPGSGVSWVNRHNYSGLNVSINDPHALATACNRILGSPELRQRLAQGARQRFLDEFQEETFIHRMIEIYRDML